MIEKTSCLSPTDLLNQVKLDVEKIYDNTQQHIDMIIDKKYVYKKCHMTITLNRKWGGDPACDGIGFYGSAKIVANSDFYDNIFLVDLHNVIREPFYCTMMGRYPKIQNISYTHITNEDLCVLILNGFFRDNSNFKFLIKDVIVEILKRVI